MLLADQVATRIVTPTAPFHFDGTVHKPSHFPSGNVCYEPGYSRLLFGAELVPARRILRTIKQRWGGWRMLASHYLFEDLFWQHQHRRIDWLESLIRS
jgi:hypothetical protein